jgi:hypothetical protein
MRRHQRNRHDRAVHARNTKSPHIRTDASKMREHKPWSPGNPVASSCLSSNRSTMLEDLHLVRMRTANRHEIAEGCRPCRSFLSAVCVHAITFYHTLKNLLGGATSAGVMKGLQAVLVDLVAAWAFCGREGGSGICVTRTKFLSLLTVVGGVVGYGLQQKERRQSVKG